MKNQIEKLAEEYAISEHGIDNSKQYERGYSHNGFIAGYTAAKDKPPSDHIPEGEIEADSLAVGFAEWIHKMGYMRVKSDTILWGIGRKNENFTTDQLLQLFKQSEEFKALNIGDGKIDWDALADEYRKFDFAYRQDNHESPIFTVVVKWFKSRPEFK